jgi:hypothetical protein
MAINLMGRCEQNKNNRENLYNFGTPLKQRRISVLSSGAAG